MARVDRARRICRFSAQTGPAAVLVVRSTRWEDGVKVLEIEEVRCQPERAARGVVIELRSAPVADAARRNHRSQGEARVEPVDVLRKQQPDLPPTDTEWMGRQVVYRVPPSPGS